MAWTYKLTKQGANLLAGLSDKKLIFSSAKFSNKVSVGHLEELTELENVIKGLEILSITSNDDTMCIELELTNIGVAVNAEVYQLGLYAKTGDVDEILFAVWQTDTPTTIPKATSMPWSKEYELYLKFSELENVTIEVNISDYLRKAHNTDTLAHADMRKQITKLQSDMAQLGEHVGDGKEELAEAITEQGVDTASTDSFHTMAENVRAISGGSGSVTLKLPNTEVSTLPYDFYGGCALYIDDEIHIFGDSQQHYKLNKTTGTWESVSTLPYNFSSGCALYIDGEIHIIGGSASKASHYLALGLLCCDKNFDLDIQGNFETFVEGNKKYYFLN